MASTRLLTKYGLAVPAAAPSERAAVDISRAYSSTLLDEVSKEIAKTGRAGRRTLLSDHELVPKKLLKYTHDFGFGDGVLEGSTLGEIATAKVTAHVDSLTSAGGALAKKQAPSRSDLKKVFAPLQVVQRNDSKRPRERTLYPERLIQRDKDGEALRQQEEREQKRHRVLEHFSCFQDNHVREDDIFLEDTQLDTDVPHEYLYRPIANAYIYSYCKDILPDFLGDSFMIQILGNPFQNNMIKHTQDDHGWQRRKLTTATLVQALESADLRILRYTEGGERVVTQPKHGRIEVTFQTEKEARRAREMFLSIDSPTRSLSHFFQEDNGTEKLKLVKSDEGWWTLWVPHELKVCYKDYFLKIKKTPDERMSLWGVQRKCKFSIEEKPGSKLNPKANITSFTKFMGHFDHNIATQLSKEIKCAFPCIETCARKYFGPQSSEAMFARRIAVHVYEMVKLQREQYIVAMGISRAAVSSSR